MGRRSVYGKGRRGYNGNNGNVLSAFDTEDNNNVLGTFDNGDDDVATIFEPTENIVNTTTNRRTVRRVHPTHIEHVNRNIVIVENYYPVTQSEVEETYAEEFDCGRDLRNPCCKPIKRRHK